MKKLFLIIFGFILGATFIWYIFIYEEELSSEERYFYESLAREIDKNKEAFISKKGLDIPLKKLTKFEWDKMCFDNNSYLDKIIFYKNKMHILELNINKKILAGENYYPYSPLGDCFRSNEKLNFSILLTSIISNEKYFVLMRVTKNTWKSYIFNGGTRIKKSYKR
jgi:hypothetical protein